MNFREHYMKNIRRDFILLKSFANPKFIPKLEKIVIQHTSRQILMYPESIIPISIAFELITGQKPMKILAKKSVASWNLRQDQLIGSKVTLRKDNMYNFLLKLVYEYFPRIKAEDNIIHKIKIDENRINPGTITIGIPDLFIFQDIEQEYDYFNSAFPNGTQFGCNITFVTSASEKEDAIELLRGFFIPMELLI